MIEKLKQLWKIVEENRNFSEDDFVYEKYDFGGTNNESVLIGIGGKVCLLDHKHLLWTKRPFNCFSL